MEQPTASSGALRGVISGATYGTAIVVLHYATGTRAHVSLGSVPPALIVITAVVGALLGALGARLSRGRAAT